MRPIDIEQALAACRDAADLMTAAASHPEAQLNSIERRELLAIATALAAIVNAPTPALPSFHEVTLCPSPPSR